MKLATVKQRNLNFTSQKHAGLVCVFVGATSGIGASTLERMISMIVDSTIYVVGRSESRFGEQLSRLESLNHGCKIIFLEAEVSLLSQIDAICKKVIEAEERIDILYMSPGLVPFNGPFYTKEGLEVCFTLSYYSRMRLISNLLPLLHRCPNPRVLSVLNAGKEQQMRDDDLGLGVSGSPNWSPFGAINHTVTMTSLAFDHLAQSEKAITFIHSSPGLVKTGIFAKLTATAPESSGVLWKISLRLIRVLVAVVMFFVGLSVEESGERQAFYLTNKEYSPDAWRVDASSDVITVAGVLDQYRGSDWPKKVWEHTVSIFERASS